MVVEIVVAEERAEAVVAVVGCRRTLAAVLRRMVAVGSVVLRDNRRRPLGSLN